MSPSLSWLQAFLCAADHLDYDLAAADLGMKPGRVLLRVQKLEQWLHKILILDDPIELNDVDGAQFKAIAWDILNRFATTCAGDDFSITGMGTSPRTKLLAKVRLHDLERFLALGDEGTYKGAALATGCDAATIYRTIKDLEKVTGHQLVRGRVSVRMTDAGEVFRNAASAIVKSLYDFRAEVPEGYDPSLSITQRIIDILERKKVSLKFTLGLIHESGKKQRGRVRPEDIHKALAELDSWIVKIQEAMRGEEDASDPSLPVAAELRHC